MGSRKVQGANLSDRAQAVIDFLQRKYGMVVEYAVVPIGATWSLTYLERLLLANYLKQRDGRDELQARVNEATELLQGCRETMLESQKAMKLSLAAKEILERDLKAVQTECDELRRQVEQVTKDRDGWKEKVIDSVHQTMWIQEGIDKGEIDIKWVGYDRVYTLNALYREVVEQRDSARAQVAGIRPEVLAFARLMEQKLRKRDYKGGWKDMSLVDLVHGLLGEVEELRFEEGQGIVDEAVDVANFAMMIADVSNPSPTRSPSHEPR